MGNLVTNRVQLTAEVGSVPEERIGEIVSVLTGLPAIEALAQARGGEEGYPIDLRFRRAGWPDRMG